MTALRWVAAYVLAVVVTTLLATVLQSQFNLAALASLGAPVPMRTRLDVTLRDLAGFGPTLAILASAGFLIAFPVTAALRRVVPRGRTALYALAGAVAIAAALVIMKAVLGLVAIAAARSPGGFAMLVACGALGGAVFAWLTRRSMDRPPG